MKAVRGKFQNGKSEDLRDGRSTLVFGRCVGRGLAYVGLSRALDCIVCFADHILQPFRAGWESLS